jgi:hypothetical protein
MNEVIVVSACTHRDGFIDEYENQLKSANIPFYLEPLDDLKGGANGFSMNIRMNFLRKMATKFIDYKILYATDAWDVLFLGTKQELIDNAPSGFLCGAERNCYPESHLAKRIHGDTPWRYCNAGLIACPPDVLLRWCDEVESNPETDILDQTWLNRRLVESSPLVSLDSHTSLFYVVSETLEDETLQTKNGRLWNSLCNTFPAFFHFSGKCPTDKIRSMLNT